MTHQVTEGSTEHVLLKQHSKEGFASRSCGIFPLKSRARRWAIKIVQHPYSEFFILCNIVANALMLSFYDPLNVNSASNRAIENAQLYFLVLYTLEMLVKMFASGLYWESSQGTYFKTGWNVIDFTVVVLGWASLGVSSLGTAASFAYSLRLFRLLRPLRRAKSFPAMAWVTRALLRSVPQLLSGGVLFVLLSIIASITGMVMFRGTLRQRCVWNADPNQVVEQDLLDNRFCALDSQPFGRRCPFANSTCAVVDFNPNLNVTSFDNLLWSVIILFEMITMEGYSEVMYWVADANGSGSQLYFVIVVILGGMFVINVLLAVLAVNITVQRDLDQSEKERNEDIKSIEQSLLARRLLSEKFGAEDISKQKHFERFLKRNQIDLKSSIEMRIMLSYERMHLVPGYKLVSDTEYNRLREKHDKIYAEWKKHITPIIDANERVAAAKRDQQDRDARRAWERRAAALSGKAVHNPSPILDQNKHPHETVTPPFVLREVEEMEVEARLRLAEAEDVKRNQFSRMDSFVEKRWSWVKSKYEEIKEDSFVGQKDEAWRIRKWCYRLVTQWWFDRYMMNAIIVLNVCILATDHFNQPRWVYNMLAISDIVFAVIFIVEMILKVCGLGVLKYLIDPWNVFDGFVAVISLVQFAETSSAFVAAFRAIRLFRLIRIIVRHKALRNILEALSKSLQVVLPFLFIVFLFVYVSTVMSLHLFGGIMQAAPGDADCSPSYPGYPHCPPKNHFDSFFSAFLTTFQVLTKDNWNDIMYKVVDASSYWAFLWFFGVIFIGTLVVLNIFLGVLIDSFLRASEERKKQAFRESQRNLIDYFGPSAKDANESEARAAESALVSVNLLNMARRASSKYKPRKHSPEDDPEMAKVALREHVDEQRRKQKKRREWHFVSHPSYPFPTVFGKISGDNIVRNVLGNLVCSPYFSNFVLVVIIISTVAVCFESSQTPPWQRIQLEIINDFVCAVFLVELLLKIFCFGLYGHPGAYLRSRWNRMDMVLASLLIVSLIVQGMGFERIIHLFRAFYALRLIRYNDGLRVAAISVARAAIPVGEVALFLMLFYLAGAILGTLLFQGKFFSCYSGPSTAFPKIPQDDLCFPVSELYSSAPCPIERQCNVSQWLNPTVNPGGSSFTNFDNVPQSFLVLFEMSALENWFVPMYAAMDSTEIGINYRREFSRYAALFFVLFVLLFNILLVQLFVAVVVDSFRQSEREEEARAFLTPRQAEWIRMQKKVVDLPFRSKELAPDEEPFRLMHRIITSSKFKRFVVAITWFNTAVLLSLHVNPSPEYLTFFDVVDYVVGAVYISEMLLKLGAFGAHQYLRRGYNWLDAAVCITTMVGWAVPEARNGVQFVDSFKILSTVYYLGNTKRLISTLWLSVPALLNVSSLVFLIFYIYAVVGVAVFSDIRNYPPLESGQFEVLDDFVNFENFGASLLTLFRMATGEGWNGIMRDMVASSNVNLANTAYPFCLSFMVVIQFSMLNLIVAVIMFDIQDEIENEAKGKSSNISAGHLVAYAKVWADVRYEYESRKKESRTTTDSTGLADENDGNVFADASPPSTPKAKRYQLWIVRFARDVRDALRAKSDFQHPQMVMPVSELSHLITRLPPPLGLAGMRNVTRGDIMRVINALQIPVNANGEIHYHTTLSVLIDRVVLGDVISKTLKQSVLGAPSPRIENSHTRDKSAAGDILDIVTDELRDLLHLQIPETSRKYRLVLESELDRDNATDAAQLIATRLLHKAAARYLARKKEAARRSQRLSSLKVRRKSGEGEDINNVRVALAESPRSGRSPKSSGLSPRSDLSIKSLGESPRNSPESSSEQTAHFALGEKLINHLTGMIKSTPHVVASATTAGAHVIADHVTAAGDAIHSHRVSVERPEQEFALSHLSPKIADDQN